MKEKTNKTKIYEVDIDWKCGPIETYRVKANSRAEARKKAKDRYMKDYFKRSLLESYVYD